MESRIKKPLAYSDLALEILYKIYIDGIESSKDLQALLNFADTFSLINTTHRKIALDIRLLKIAITNVKKMVRYCYGDFEEKVRYYIVNNPSKIQAGFILDRLVSQMRYLSVINLLRNTISYNFIPVFKHLNGGRADREKLLSLATVLGRTEIVDEFLKLGTDLTREKYKNLLSNAFRHPIKKDILIKLLKAHAQLNPTVDQHESPLADAANCYLNNPGLKLYYTHSEEAPQFDFEHLYLYFIPHQEQCSEAIGYTKMTAYAPKGHITGTIRRVDFSDDAQFTAIKSTLEDPQKKKKLEAEHEILIYRLINHHSDCHLIYRSNIKIILEAINLSGRALEIKHQIMAIKQVQQARGEKTRAAAKLERILNHELLFITLIEEYQQLKSTNAHSVLARNKLSIYDALINMLKSSLPFSHVQLKVQIERALITWKNANNSQNPITLLKQPILTSFHALFKFSKSPDSIAMLNKCLGHSGFQHIFKQLDPYQPNDKKNHTR